MRVLKALVLLLHAWYSLYLNLYKLKLSNVLYNETIRR